MKVVNFWKTLFCAALAVTAFSACSDDDEEGGYSGMPEITVNGGESVTVAGKLEGGKLEQTVEVVSKGDWTLTFKNSGVRSGLLPARCRARPVRRSLPSRWVRLRESAAQSLF